MTLHLSSSLSIFIPFLFCTVILFYTSKTVEIILECIRAKLSNRYKVVWRDIQSCLTKWMVLCNYRWSRYCCYYHCMSFYCSGCRLSDSWSSHLTLLHRAFMNYSPYQFPKIVIGDKSCNLMKNVVPLFSLAKRKKFKYKTPR